MTTLPEEKPAGGNLRVGEVASSMGAGDDGTQVTPEVPDCNDLANKVDQAMKEAGLPAVWISRGGRGSSRSLADNGGDAQFRTAPTRDSWDKWDTAPPLAVHGPSSTAACRDNWDAPSGARFELVVGQRGRRDGVYWIGIKKAQGGDPPEELPAVWVCSPLWIEATTRDGFGSEWGRLLLFPDRDGRWHRWAMPMPMLAGSGEELRAELLRQGQEITSDTSHRKRLLDYIQWACPDVAARCVSRTGWDGNVFVLPSCTYGEVGTEPVIFQTSAPDGVALSQSGTLAEWRRDVAEACCGNSRLVVSLSAGFAALCMGLIGAEGGGVHLRGGSSSGKSTALSVAASIYGPPRYVRTWRQTDNALEGIAAQHSDMLLVLDEMGQLEPRVAGACAYLLANGQGKGRARRDGVPRAPATFRVLFLSAGEIGLGDLVAQDGGRVRAGQEVRVVDLPAEAGAGLGLFDHVPDGMSPGAYADALKAAAGAHHGHALPAFLEAVVADVNAARSVLLESRDALAHELADGNQDGQVRRVAGRFALIGAAGELATGYGLTGWPPGEARRAVIVCFRDWLQARGTKGNAEPAAMLAQVRRFLEANGDARFTDWFADGQGPRIVNRAGYRRKTEAGHEYFIEKEVFRTEVAAGFDSRAVARVLLNCGVLMPDTDGNPTRKERLPDRRLTRVYRVLPTIWDDLVE